MSKKKKISKRVRREKALYRCFVIVSIFLYPFNKFITI